MEIKVNLCSKLATKWMNQLKNILESCFGYMKNQYDGLSSDNYLFLLKSKMSLSFKNVEGLIFPKSSVRLGYIKTKCHNPLKKQAFNFYGVCLNLHRSMI